MITFRNGNLFDSHAKGLVNPVNCVGVMGRGLAAQFKARYPGNFQLYHALCLQGQMSLGKMYVTHGPDSGRERYIINFPTKQHWKDDSHLASIEAGLHDLHQVLLRHHIESVAIPRIGCGLGGLSWMLVRPLISGILSQSPQLQVEIYE